MVNATSRCAQRLYFVIVIALAFLVPQLHAQTPPTYNAGTFTNGSAYGGGAAIAPQPWPLETEWHSYSWGTTYPDLAGDHAIRDIRSSADPSNGGTTPQNYVSVSSGCPDGTLPSIYYFYNSSTKMIYFRWRVNQIANNYATGPAPGAYSSTSPWNSALWTVFFSITGTGYRDFAAHLDGSSGAPAQPVDVLRSIWSPLQSNSIDYVGDPTNIHSLLTNPTAFVNLSTNQIEQFNGNAVPTTVQWPNGASETIWDYGTTRSINISTASCTEYFVDYEIPLAMLNASAFGGPQMTENTPFQFLFATANSLNNPFQKDVVWEGSFVCDATSPGPFGDAVTLAGGTIPQPIATSFSAGTRVGCTIPVRAQIMDALNVTNCQTISQIVTAQFKYWYDANGNGLDDDAGGQWFDIGDPTTPVGTIVTANWDLTNLVQGQYLLALEITDNRGHTTQTWMGKSAAPLTQQFGTDNLGPGGSLRHLYTNVPPFAVTFPYQGLTAQTLGINYAKVTVGNGCGAPPPAVTKTHNVSSVAAGGAITYTLTIPNTSGTTITVSSISDTLPSGFTYASTGAGTLGAPSTSPSVGASGTISWTFPGGTTIPGSSTRTFIFTVNAGTSAGTFFNTASVVTNIGSLPATDTSGVTVTTAELTAAKFAALASAPSTPVSIFNKDDVVRFNITYTNNSTATVTGINVSDPLPAGFTYQSSSPTATTHPAVDANGPVTWSSPDISSTLAPGNSVTVTVDAKATQAGSFINTASICPSGCNAPAVQAATSGLVSGAVLTISKIAAATSVVPAGNGTVLGVIVTNGGTGYTSAPAVAFSAPPAGGTTATGTATFSGGAVTGVTITNVGSGYTSTPTVTFTGGGGVNAAAVATLAFIDYTIQYANIGTATATGLTFSDAIPSGFTLQTSASTAGCTQSGTTVTCNLASSNGTSLTAGTTALVTLRFAVSTSAPNPSNNTVTMTSTNAATVTGTYSLAVVSNTCTDTTYYWRTTSGAVGNGPGYSVAYISMTANGSGYSSTPTVSFSGGAGSGAAGTAYGVTGTGTDVGVFGINMTDGGSGYTSAPTVTISGPGSGAAGTAVLTNNQFLADTTSGSADTLTTERLVQGITYGEVIRFYGPVDSTTSYVLGTSATIKTGWRVTQATPQKFSYQVTLAMYNPATEAIVSVATAGEAAFNIPVAIGSDFSRTISMTVPSGTVLRAGWRLVWIVYAKDSGNGSTVTKVRFLYNGNTANYQSYGIVCLTPLRVSLVKHADKLTVTPGVDSLTYTLQYTNTSTVTVPQVVVTDPLPAGTTFVSSSAVAATAVASATVTLGGSGYSQSSPPTVTISGGGGAGATATAVVVGGAVIAVEITNSGSGYTSTPTIAIAAPTSGTTATATAVMTGSTTPTIGTNGTITWRVGSVASGATASLTVTVNTLQSMSGTSVTDTGTLANLFGPNVTSSTTTILARPNVLVSKRASGTNFIPGNSFTYTIDVVNAGTGIASAVVLTDPLPSIISPTSFTAPTTSVASVTITGGGSGFTSAPGVIFTGTGSGAAGTAVISAAGAVTAVIVTNGGTGYTSAPSISFSGGGGSGATATAVLRSVTGVPGSAGATVTFTVGAMTAGSTATLTLTVSVASTGVPAGTNTVTNTASVVDSFDTTPRTSSATVTVTATPRLQLKETASPLPLPLTAINITAGGTGYASAPAVTITGCAVAPTAVATVSGGAVTEITITNSGAGCTAPVISFGGPGSGATASSTTGQTTGGLLNVAVTNGGSGYSSAPTVTVTGCTGATATATVSGGAVTGVTITNTGTNCSAVPTISFGGPGTGAIATAAGGERVVYVNVTAGGSYPSVPTVSFSGGNCTGVTATVSTNPVASLSGPYTVTGVTITNGGSGCTGIPSVVFSGSGGAAATATIGAAPGDTVQYQVTVTNIGTADATGVVITDAIPANTAWQSGGTFSIGSVSSSVIPTLAVGASSTLTYTVQVNNALANGVTILSTSASATSTNAAAPTGVGTTVNSGATPQYSITMAPTGDAVGDPLTALASTATSTTSIVVNSSSLLSTGSYVAIFSGSAWQIAKITAISGQLVVLDTAVSASAGTSIIPVEDYTINYANIGHATGTSVVVTDYLPSALLFAGVPTGATAVSTSPAIGSTGNVTWNIGTLTNGSSGTLDILVFPNAAGTYTNVAAISDGTALNTRNASTTATTTFGALAPSKVTTTSQVTAGNVAHYSITVQNPLALTTATGVVVTDNLPTGFTYKANSTFINGSGPAADPGGTSTSPVWSGVALNIPGNGTLTLAFDADVASSVPTGTYENEILVSSANVLSLVFDYLGTPQEDVKVCAAAPAIHAPSALCANSAGNIASAAADPNATFSWSISNGTITTASTGTVDHITIGSGGSGYSSAPTVVFTGGGGGSGAAATATVVGNVVTAITMTNFGSGYNAAPVISFSGGAPGSGATAAATLGSGIIFTAGTAGTDVVLNMTKTEGSCSVAATPVSVPVNASPSISVQPSSQTICTVPGSVTFSATVSGADAATPYQWQISIDGGSTFSNIGGANSSSYTFTAVAADDGKQYRVIAFNASGCSVTSNAATLHVSCNPDLELTTNSDSPDPVFAGNNITYTQLITNVSNTQLAHNVTLNETTPPNTTFVSMTPPAGWTCGTLPAVGGTGSIVCTDGSNLAGGANSGNFILVLNVNSTTADPSTITETASTATTDTDSVLSNNSNTTTTTVQRRIDIATVKTNNASNIDYGPGFIYPGNPATAQPLQWYATMTNNGPSRATGVTLVDPIPSGFTYGNSMAATVTNGGSGYTSAPAVTISGGAGGSGAAAVAKLGGFISIINVTAGGTGYISEPTVTISGGNCSGATATSTINDSGAVTSITITNAGSGCTSAPSVTFGGPGSGATATATVLGTPGSVAQIVFTNVGSGYTSPPSASFSGGGPGSGAVATPSLCIFNSGNGIVTCNVGTLDKGATTTLTIDGMAGAGAGQLINTASPTYNETDSNTANDNASSMVTVLAPTLVKMLAMDAVQTKNAVTVTWQTSFEQDNLGFYVWRERAGGSKERVTKSIIIGSAFFTGKKISQTTRRSYRFVDAPPAAGQFVQYYVEDVDLKGVHTMHGPITPKISNATTTTTPVTDPDPVSGGIFVTQPGMGVTAPAPMAPAAQRLAQQWNVAATPAAKLVVTQAGWVRVKKSDLVAAGFDPGSVSRSISVFADGIEVPIVIPEGNFGSNDAIEFYGTGIDTTTAGGRVYYVTKGIGNALRAQGPSGKPGSGAPAPASTPYTFSRVERNIFFTALVNNGDRDNFFGALIVNWFGEPATNAITVSNLDPNGGNAALEVVIQGSTEDFDHAVGLSLNGHDLGVVRFRSQARSVSNFSIPVSWLTEGENTLAFTAVGGDDDISLVESVKLTYAHRFVADSNALAFAVPGATAVTVSGFTTDQVRVVDLTDPQAPQFLPVTVTTVGGAKSVAFATTGIGTRTIFAFGDDRVQPPAQIVVNAPSTLNAAKNTADLVIITNKAFASAAASLKVARDAQGISTTIADVQNVYDEFSYGAHGPEAIRAFLQRAKSSWTKAPRYAIFLGDSSFDPRNYLGMGNVDFVPTKLVATAYLKTSSDDWFADFNDTGLAQIAMGRIPVRTSDEAAAVVNKLVRRASVTGPWLKNVEIISDRTNGVSFTKGADQLAALVPGTFTTGRISFAATPNPSQAVIDSFNSGALLTNYIGHGSVEIWSNDVFSSTAASALTNGDKLPFVVTMNCLNGYFHDLFQESLAEALLKNGSGGAIGVWASSALTSPDQQLRVNLALYRQLFGGTTTIGDAILKAKQETTDIDVRRTWILFGDPTLKLQP